MIKRYLVDFNLDEISKKYCDVVIIGSGIAGLYTAMNTTREYKVSILTKDKIIDNNSNLAQGGIAACISDEDDRKLHIEDTLKAGSYFNDKEAVRILVNEAIGNIEKLVGLGTVFDKDDKGNLMVTREGGHSKRRILHSKDQTGKEIIRALTSAVGKRDNIEVVEGAFVIDILTYGEKAIGVLVKSSKEIYALFAKFIVISTGGIGQVYKNTTNSMIATGDGIAMAYRAGVNTIDMEFVQFHPTAFYSEKDRKRFLISEAVRGEGGILKNSKGQAFMNNYHELRDLAPRDIVAKAIITEMKKEKRPNVYLDITHKDEEFIKNRFPYIYNECLRRGIDITKEYIPVCPVQHYVMGGIETDYIGRTNIDNLYACGETASVRVHGANRLASNSLLEGIVFGNRVANDINNNKRKRNICDLKLEYLESKEEIEWHLEEVKEAIRETMSKNVFIFRNEKGLNDAYQIIKEILKKLNRYREESREYYECVNIATVAYLIITSALKRKKSLGSHIVIDSLEVDSFV